MYIQEISIEIKSEFDKEELVYEFGYLMVDYRNNGQTQGLIESQYINETRIVCLPSTLEINSLDSNFNNTYVDYRIKKIEEICKSKFKFRTVGKSFDYYIAPCECPKSEYYILITNYATTESPLTCGNCNKSVPLYRLPKYYKDDYLPILSWESNYIACDRLQMNCEVGENWALNQMEKLDSQLSKQGLKICKKIEELTQINTYYYLHNWKKYKGDTLQRHCPGCNNKWGLKKPLHKIYDFRCDKCKLISTISPNA
ncbi:MAG: DUF2310 family Zn-ribbon-containing protein [Bacteroidia bacterium]